MWHVFQALVIFAVVASNIRWHWTPSGMLAGILGVALAFVLTIAVNGTARVGNWLRQHMGKTL